MDAQLFLHAAQAGRGDLVGALEPADEVGAVGEAALAGDPVIERLLLSTSQCAAFRRIRRQYSAGGVRRCWLNSRVSSRSVTPTARAMSATVPVS